MSEKLDFIWDYDLNYINPDFCKKSKVHDWKNYVPENWAKNWNEFTEREKKIIAVLCAGQADKEEWD
jgi:hypothetical protein